MKDEVHLGSDRLYIPFREKEWWGDVTRGGACAYPGLYYVALSGHRTVKSCSLEETGRTKKTIVTKEPHPFSKRTEWNKRGKGLNIL